MDVLIKIAQRIVSSFKMWDKYRDEKVAKELKKNWA
jgi:hypothetical protein